MNTRYFKTHLGLLWIGASMICVSAFGTTLVALDLDDLTLESDSIVTGRVVDATSFLRDGRIFTLNRIEVDEALDDSSSSGEIIEVVTAGGRSEHFSQKVFGAPELEVGGRYLFFLQYRSKEVTRTLGMSQGAYRLREDPETRKWLVHPGSSAARLVRRSGKKGRRLVDVAPWLNRTRPLSDIAEEIRTILEAAR